MGAAIPVVDVNKNTIMSMLRTDVFGFKAEDIESQAKMVYNLVSNGSDGDVKYVGGYVRNKAGYVIITPTISSATAKPSRKKNNQSL